MFILRTIDGGKIHTMDISINAKRFPDGTLSLGTVPKYFDEIMWLYDGDEELFTLLCLRNHMVKPRIKLIMPYIPHARMDRVENGEVFTLKTFCQVINSMNFSEVVVADPHSNVSSALLDRVKVLSPRNYIQKAATELAKMKEVVIYFYPDDGAMKRYSKMFPGLPYAYGLKDRDWKTGNINSLQLVNSSLVRNNPILIIDDICSRGGTFHRASKALCDAGAKSIYLYVTHCEETIFHGEMYAENLVKAIFTTDSKITFPSDTPNGTAKVKVIYSFAEDFRNGKIF